MPWDFLLPFPFSLYSHLTSCIRDSLHFVRRFAPSKCVRCGTSSILLSPTKKKASCASRRDAFFLALSLPPYLSFNLLHPRLTTFCASLCSFKMCSLRNQFDPVFAHQKKASRDPLRGAFFLPFSFFPLRSYNLLHPRLTTFCASLRSFKMCSLRNQFDPVIAHHNEKFHVLRAVGFFVVISLFPHLSSPPALKKSIASHPPKGYNT